MTDEAVGDMLAAVDLVADRHDVSQEGLLKETLSRVRKRGDDNE